MARCSCGDGGPAGINDSVCEQHKLGEGSEFPPMLRHALRGETVVQTQRRLYLASRGQIECTRCGRIGKRDFGPADVVIPADSLVPVEQMPRLVGRYVCTSRKACAKRARRAGRRVTWTATGRHTKAVGERGRSWAA